MTKAIDESKLIDFPFEDSQVYGRNYIEEMFYARNAGDTRRMAKIWEQLFVNIALSTIKWNNVPQGVDTRAIEYILLHYGCGGMFLENGGALFAQAGARDQLNMYWNPNEVLLTAPNGQQWTRHAEAWVAPDENGKSSIAEPDCAICWDNSLRLPILPVIRKYSQRIAKCDGVIDCNIEAQRTPWIIAAPAEQKRNARRWQKKFEGNDQYIPVNENATLPYTLNTQAPFIADKVKVMQHELINECLTFIGVDNSSIDKKERVQTAEVLSNNEQIAAMRESRLKCRRQFAERANKLFRLQIEPEWGIEGVYADIVAALKGGGLTGLQMLQANKNEGEE